MISIYLVDALKAACICGFVSLIGWILLYTRLAPWWRNPIGRTLVAKTLLVACLLVPSTLALYFPTLNHVLVSWLDLVLIGLITPVMIWRSAVWIRLYQARKLRNGDRNATTLEQNDEA
jgi:hypothetical protein